MTQETRFFALQGGLDLVTPAIQTPAGRVIAGINYEPHPRGYRRIDGIERFDGRAKPSEASYWVLDFDAGQAAISEGDTVTGATSGATGVALVDAVVESGTYGGSDAAGYLVLTAVSGTFQDNENLQVSAATKSVANGTASARGADTDADDTTWYRDAIETARTAIAKPAGSGAVRGVWVYDGNVYCFRDNAGGTAGTLLKATTAGWVAQDLGRQVDFTSGGTYEIAEGDTIEGATSAATATVERVVLTSGTFAGGDAAGYLILSGQTGTFQAENLDVGASTNVATIAGNSSAITLPAAGRYDFDNHNFFGASDLLRMYGANGVGRAFEWDGSVLVPIRTGMATDTPTRIGAHRNHLFATFPGGSLQHSGIGAPYDWTVLSGASEIGLGEEITDILPSVVGAMGIFGRNKVAALFGTDSDNWELRELANDAGGIAWTAQNIGSPHYMDSRGLRSMEATQAFGDFRIGTKTQLIEPFFAAKRKAGASPVASLRVRAKDQYRLFYDDGTGITVYFGRKTPEIMVFDYGSDVIVSAACSGKDAEGNELLFIGTEDGWVYQVDAGTSLDGAAISAYVRLPFNHVGSPAQDKRWHKATLEVDCTPNTELGIVAEYAYGNPDLPSGTEQSFTVQGGGGMFDEDTWDDFYWSSPVEGLAEAHIDGLGQNISIVVVSEATYEEPHILHGLTLHFSYRRLKR